MASKRDFTGINTGRVYNQIETATSKKGQQGKASPQEQEQRAQDLKTQGRKGCKATRINMAFTPDNYEFIKVMAKAAGRTMTQFTNDIIAAYRKEHPEFMQAAGVFLDLIKAQEWSEHKEDI